MNKNKLLSISLIFVLAISMVGITTGSASSPLLMNENTNDLSYNHSPVAIKAADNDLSSESSALPSFNGFWTDMVDAEQSSNDGSGVYVAVLDTGLLSNWASIFSQANIREDLGVGFSHDILYDENGLPYLGPLRSDRGFVTDLASGHGTHVTSTITGYSVYGNYWINGVAPSVQIIPVLVLDAWLYTLPDGSIGTFSGGTDAMVVSGIMYIAELASSLDGPVVINMSLGGSSPSPAIYAAIQYAISQGVTIVASAGNSGSDGMGYPGAFPEVISAAATGWTTMFANGWTADVPEGNELHQGDILGNSHQIYLENFSSRPNKTLDQKHQDLDVAAPGAFVVGPYKSAFANNFGYYYLSGTSMAAPHVSAIAAQVLESHPGLTQSEMEFILKLAAQGMPLPANDAIVYYPFTPELFYSATWDGGDYGAGFLTVPNALSVAATHA